MNPQSTSFIFPAFVSEYLGNEIDIVRNLTEDFDTFKHIITSKFYSDFSCFSLADRRFTENELYSQVGSYLFGCAIASGLMKKGLTPNFAAGNSMGLYAALYCGGVVNFEDGLLMLKKAYELIRQETKGRKMGMRAIVGLDLNDVKAIISQTKSKAFIANKNGTYSFLISGEKESIEFALELAKKEGALFTSLVSVESPYHTDFIKDAAIQFGQFIDKNITLKDPSVCIISSVNQQELKTASQLRDELVRNIYHPINWYNSMVHMIEAGAECFFECGAGNSLTKLARFISKDVKVYPINKIDEVLA